MLEHTVSKVLVKEKKGKRLIVYMREGSYAVAGTPGPRLHDRKKGYKVQGQQVFCVLCPVPDKYIVS